MDHLNFQDFQFSDTDRLTTGEIGDHGERAEMVRVSETERKSGRIKKNIFSLDYYQQFFDIDTDQVITRLLYSMYPQPGSNYISDRILAHPDICGPFWICVTLVFSIAICGNLANYIETVGDVKSHHYSSDFRFVTGAATLVTSYIIFTPFLLLSVFRYWKMDVCFSYMELLCAYGYSLTVFIPVSILSVVNISSFRWLLIFISVSLSGTVLASSIWQMIRSNRNTMMAIVIFGGILAVHFSLGAFMKIFYFDVTQSGHVTIPIDSGLPITKEFTESTLASVISNAVVQAGLGKDRIDRSSPKRESNDVSASENVSGFRVSSLRAAKKR